jgi:hypothetical protein
LVGRAAEREDRVREEAVAELLTIYRPALRAFLVGTRRIPPNLADDLLHDFIADKILARRILARADRDRGRFRNFMVKSLSNYASSRLKQLGGSEQRTVELDEAVLLSAASRQDTDRFDQEWVHSLVRDALALMEGECRQRGRLDLWEILHARAVAPILDGAPPIEYEQIVTRFGLETPRQAINLLATAKRAFMRHLRVAVGRYVEGEARIEEEIADLREIVGR